MLAMMEDALSKELTAKWQRELRGPIRHVFTLEVSAGPSRGSQLQLDGTEPTRTLIGKSRSCQLQLSDAAVSRRHLAVEVVGDRLRVEDLDSTNGTTVEGVQISGAWLQGGESIQLGKTVIRTSSGAVVSKPLSEAKSFGSIIGGSVAMRRLYPLCERLAATDVPVLIEGETGTGKEVLAESIHQCSPRRDKPFVVFDCTAVAPNLIESELFGHVRGAFTGSVASSDGVFVRAHGGTLLIDEIGDMPLSLQPKLLRAIERLQVKPLGANQTRKVDVRLLAATRRDLDREVQQGSFRDDLFHRFTVARVELPPLRTRRGDVTLLARHFAALSGHSEALDEELLRRWEGYGWPGNVRELRNAVTRRVALGDLDELTMRASQPPPPPERAGARHVPAEGGDLISALLALDLPLPQARQRMIDELEDRYLDRILAAHNGNISRAAAAAGVTRRHFYRLLERHQKR